MIVYDCNKLESYFLEKHIAAIFHFFFLKYKDGFAVAFHWYTCLGTVQSRFIDSFYEDQKYHTIKIAQYYIFHIIRHLQVS